MPLGLSCFEDIAAFLRDVVKNALFMVNGAKVESCGAMEVFAFLALRAFFFVESERLEDLTAFFCCFFAARFAGVAEPAVLFAFCMMRDGLKIFLWRWVL